MKRLVCLLLLLANVVSAVTVVENEIELPILTPSLQERKTLKLRLDNGLEAYLISDPNSDKSGAALSVQVGSWSDPVEYPGLAHFTEHMLFLGTKKYPNEGEYQRFISQHGGLTNAFTSYDSTNYIFSLDNRYYEGALDRFSDFFKDPLFNPSGVSRELQAVDQEYAKNLQNDFLKQHSVEKALANPAHPFSRFSMGNSATLSCVTQQVLQNFYQSHYSANNMRLIAISPLPLEQMKELIVSRFTPIENRQIQPLKIQAKATTDELNGQIVYIEPIRQLRSLDIVWEIPQQFVQMKDSKPDRLISYILGYEGEKSLLAQLKREDLAESLSCGSLPLSKTHSLFYIDIDLTEKGLLQKDTVIERAFQTLKGIKEIPPYLFQNMQDAEKLRYQYQPSEDVFEYLMKNIHSIQDEKIETYPLQSSITQKFDPGAVKTLLQYLTPQNAHIELVTQLADISINADKTEPWTHTKYAVHPLPHDKIMTWANVQPHVGLGLPEQNRFIPQSFALVSRSGVSAEFPRPLHVMHTDMANIFFAEDNQFKVPQIYWYFEIKTPKISGGDATSVVLADLYIKTLTEALNHVKYQASLADLKFNFQQTLNGISLTLTGYSDKAENLFDEVLLQLKPKAISEEKFKIYKESLYKQYLNFSKESPLQQAVEVLKEALNKNYSCEKEKAAAIKKITCNRFQTFLGTLFHEVYLEGMLYGNMQKEQALHLSNKLLAALNGRPYPSNLHIKPEVLSLPANRGPFLLERNSKSGGNALILALEGNRFTFKERAAQQIGMSAISQPFYAALRTKQQTGYIVQSMDKELEKQLFNLFLIQSNTHDGDDLLVRTEQFLENQMQELTHEVDEKAFETIKTATLTELKQPPKSMKEMGELLTSLAFKFDADFDWRAKRIQGMEALDYPEFLQITKQMFGRQNKKRLAIVVKGVIPQENSFKFSRLRGITELKEIGEYKKFQSL